MTRRARGMVAAWALGSAVAAATTSLPPAMERALAVAAREMTAGHPAIRCERATGPDGYTCTQAMGNGGRHYAVLALSARPAGAPVRAGTARVDSAFVGPGGGSTRYFGQTADHRFDIVVTRAEELGAADRSLFPAPARLIARVTKLYAADR